MHQQRALATGADARDVVEGADRHALGAFGAVGAYGEAVGLVTKALQVEQDRIVGRQRDLATAGKMEDLAAGVAIGALGDRDHWHVMDARILHYLAHGGELALAAVDHHQVRPFAPTLVRSEEHTSELQSLM